jgi:hypothetical protein
MMDTARGKEVRRCLEQHAELSKGTGTKNVDDGRRSQERRKTWDIVQRRAESKGAATKGGGQDDDEVWEEVPSGPVCQFFVVAGGVLRHY